MGGVDEKEKSGLSQAQTVEQRAAKIGAGMAKAQTQEELTEDTVDYQFCSDWLKGQIKLLFRKLANTTPADNSVDEDTQRRRDVEASIAIEKVEQQRDHHDRMAQEYFRKWQAAETEVTKLQMQLSDVSRPAEQEKCGCKPPGPHHPAGYTCIEHSGPRRRG